MFVRRVSCSPRPFPIPRLPCHAGQLSQPELTEPSRHPHPSRSNLLRSWSWRCRSRARNKNEANSPLHRPSNRISTPSPPSGVTSTYAVLIIITSSDNNRVTKQDLCPPPPRRRLHLPLAEKAAISTISTLHPRHTHRGPFWSPVIPVPPPLSSATTTPSWYGVVPSRE